MEINNRDKQIILHILNYCEEIANTIERIQTKENFDKDFFYKNALSMPIFQIGELVNHLTEEFRATFTEIPWHKIIGMRNLKKNPDLHTVLKNLVL